MDFLHTVFPHIIPAGIILCSLQMRVLLENTTFLLHKVIRIAGIFEGGPYMRKYGIINYANSDKKAIF